MRSMSLVPLVACVAPATAHAISKVEAIAEHTRLSEEMVRLAKRGHWRGVDRSYRAIASLGNKGVDLSFDDHYLGAQAARELGNVTLVYRRLIGANAVTKNSDASNWLADIRRQYGEVDLIIPSRYKGEANLSVAMMPLQPDQRSTIGMAQVRIAEGLSYGGLLPGGEYTFGVHTFVVTPGGDTIVLQVSKGGSSQVSKRKAGESGPFRFTYAGLRADLGFGWTQATDGGVGEGPGGFGGIGGRVGIGYEVGIGGRFGVLVQTGYQGLTGSPSDASGPLGDVDRFDLRKDQLHIGFAWLAGVMDIDKLWLAAGPMVGIGGASVTGVSQTCIDEPSSSACSTLGEPGEQTLRYSRMDGSVAAGGAALGVAYPVVELGRLTGSVSLNAGALSDTRRWYPFGSLGFTVGPVRPEEG